jgi:SOS-response transcriptional repressor LexA
MLSAMEACYDPVMGPGENLQVAVRRHGIEPKELARRLNVTAKAVYHQFERDNPQLGTLARYADAMTAILHERGDIRVFTPESLQAGPDPFLPTDAPDPNRFVVGRATFQPGDTPTPTEPADSPAHLPLARHLHPPQAIDEPHESLVPTEPMLVSVRDLGEVPCGTPVNLSDRGYGRMVQVDRSSLGPRWRPETCFVVTARGSSMTAYKIADGAQLTVDADMPWRSGDIVVAWVNDGTAVRRIVAVDDGYELRPGAEGYRTIHVTSRDEARVVGVVVWVQPAGWSPG